MYICAVCACTMGVAHTFIKVPVTVAIKQPEQLIKKIEAQLNK